MDTQDEALQVPPRKRHRTNLISGRAFIFRGRRGDLIKLLWWDGDGLCLFAKRLERGPFLWPKATSGTVALTHAQLSMLLEGIEWRHPVRVRSYAVVNEKDVRISMQTAGLGR